MTDFYGASNTNDNFVGGADSDNFFFPVGYLNASDLVQGNGGVDTLTFQSTGTIDVSTLGGVAGVERYRLGNGPNLFSMSDGRASLNGGLITILANNGNDGINMSQLVSAGNRVDITAGLGNDTLRGSANADLFRFAATALTASDLVQGKGGFDTLILTAAGAASLAGVSEIEAVQLAVGGISVTINDAIANANAATLAFTGSVGNDLINASAVTLASRSITIAAGGGHDTLRGGAGSDNFAFTLADLTISDIVQGNGGTDTLQFLTTGTVGAATLAGVTGIERYLLANGSNFFSMSDGRASLNGGRIVIVGNDGNDNIDMAQLVSAGNRTDITAGGGNDVLRGSSGADIFRFTASQLTVADTVRGNGGVDSIEFSTAGVIGAGALSTVTEVERYVLANGVNLFSMSNGRATLNGGLITILGNNGNDGIDMSQLVSAGNRVDISSGSGNDSLRGSQNDDIFRFAAGDLTAADTVQGNGGTDMLILTTAGTASLAGVSGVESLQLGAGGISLNVNDASSTLDIIGSNGNDTVSGNFTGNVTVTTGAGIDNISGVSVIRIAPTELTSADHLSARYIEFTSSGTVTLEMSAGLTGIIKLSDGTNSFSAAGLRTVIGSDGDDYIYLPARNSNSSEQAGSSITAGYGNDTLIGGEFRDTYLFETNALNQYDRVSGIGPYVNDILKFTTPGNVDALDLTNVSISYFILADGANSLTLNQIISSYYGITVIGGTGNDFIDGSALTSDNFAKFLAGGGHDVLRGGQANDFFYFDLANLDQSDVVQGNAGTDTLVLSDSGVLTSQQLAGVAGVEQIILDAAKQGTPDGGQNYLTLTDAVIGSTDSHSLVVIGGIGNNSLDASGVLSNVNSVNFFSGRGIDTFTGGAGADSFRFEKFYFTSADTVNGGNGTDTLYINGENLSFDFNGYNITNIESFAFSGAPQSYQYSGNPDSQVGYGGPGYNDGNYTVTLSNDLALKNTSHVAVVTTGFGNDMIDARQISGGAYTLNTGWGTDTVLVGFGGDGATIAGDLGLNNDILRVYAGGLVPTISGGANIDTLEVDNPLGNGSFTMAAGMSGFEIVNLVNSFAAGSMSFTSNNTAGLTVIGTKITDSYAITLGTGGQTVVGNALDDVLTSSGGADILSGGGGHDVLYGGGASDTLNGGDGNDDLFGGEADDTLHGDAGDDFLDGGAGSDLIYGEGGADRFHWSLRDAGIDSFYDFSIADDLLSFDSDLFDFNGAAFDTRVLAGSTATNIDGADLIIYTGGNLNDIADVDAYLDSAAGGNAGEGAFILGTRNNGTTALYHVTDTSGAAPDVHFLATFNSPLIITDFQLSDFFFL